MVAARVEDGLRRHNALLTAVDPGHEPRFVTARDDLPWFSPHEDAQGFFNPWTARQLVGPTQVGRWMLAPNPLRSEKRRARPPDVLSGATDAWQSLTAGARVQWLGHASDYGKDTCPNADCPNKKKVRDAE